jgi:hypothetical protein
MGKPTEKLKKVSFALEGMWTQKKAEKRDTKAFQ